MRVGLTIAAVLTLSAWAGGAWAQIQPPEEVTDLEAVTAIGQITRMPLTNVEYNALAAVDRGAAHFSLEQVASYICRASTGSGGRPVNSMNDRGISLGDARAAYTATEEFELTKQAVREGRASMEQLVAAERVRQAAVLRMDSSNRFGLTDLARTQWGTLHIEATDFRVARGQNEQVLVASVKIVNRGNRAATIPAVTLKSLDRADRVLADITYDARPPYRLAPGESQLVEIAFTNMPHYTYNVRAHFGEGSYGRNPRDCPAAQALHRPETARLDLSANDSVQRVLDGALAAGEAPKLQIQLTGSRWTVVSEREAFEITVKLRNPGSVPLQIPALAIVLYDGENRPVGRSVSAAPDARVAAGGEEDLVLTIDRPERLPAAGDANPLTLLKHVALVVN